MFLRQAVAQRQRGPVQLDLFIPLELGREFKVIVTNKMVGAEAVLAFHNGRGAQEGLFAQLKSQCQIDYVPRLEHPATTASRTKSRSLSESTSPRITRA